ncbi:MAG: ferric reductase-like transmembrane domain-containing protein [Caldilineaceae bacterium]|nr:ferric reductase-like transmembrane domain-containing protein [Caldilineaceae bacterium]
MTTQTHSTRSPDILIMLVGSLIGAIAVLTAATLLPTMALREPAALTAAGSAVTDTLRQEATIMALPLTEDTPAYWYMARAGGIVAYLLLWFATFWGVAMSGKLTKGALKPALLFGLHEFFPFLAVIFAAVHALVLLGDQYIHFQLRDLLLPFTASYKPVWTGLGTVSFYLSTALIASFYVRKRIGRRAWRAFHYLAYVAFVLALIHGLMEGSDSGHFAMHAVYLFTGASVLFATYYRIFSAKPKGSKARTAPRAAAGSVSRPT